MRFLQLRQQAIPNDLCHPYSLLTKNYNKTMEIYCYGDYNESQKNGERFFAYLRNMTLPDHIALRDKCKIDMSYRPECEIIKAFEYRKFNESYVYYGSYQNYVIKEGFYCDIPMINKDNPYDYLNYTFITDFLDNYWIDLSTRLIMITFNILDTMPEQTLYSIK